MPQGTLPSPQLNVLATGSTASRTLADRSADWVNAADYGVKADGTDQTNNLQAAINAAQASGPNYTQTPGRTLQLPHGKIVHSGVSITAPINIVGHGRWGTVLSLKSGSTAPAITISLATTPFSSVSGFAEVLLRGLQITSPDRTDAPGLGVAHGIALLQPASPQTVAVLLDEVLINNVPGDSIHSSGLTGFVEATNCELSYPGGYNIYANSVFDWIWTGGNIYGAIQDDVLLSGTTNFRLDRLNIFVGRKTNINLFNSTLVVTNSMLDITGTDGIFVSNPNGARVDFIGCTFRWSGTNTNATYSDINLGSANTGNVYLTGCVFSTPASSPNANKPKNNINFTAGNTGVAYLCNTSFDLGAPATTGVTNDITKIANAAGPATITSATPSIILHDTAQGANLRRMVIQNNSQTLQFYSTTDAGALATLCMTIDRNGIVLVPALMRAGAIQTVAPLVNAANDAAAATAGVAVNQFYRNGSAVMQRIT